MEAAAGRTHRRQVACAGRDRAARRRRRAADTRPPRTAPAAPPATATTAAAATPGGHPAAGRALCAERRGRCVRRRGPGLRGQGVCRPPGRSGDAGGPGPALRAAPRRALLPLSLPPSRPAAPPHLSAARLGPAGRAEPPQVDADGGRNLESRVEARSHPGRGAPGAAGARRCPASPASRRPAAGARAAAFPIARRLRGRRFGRSQAPHGRHPQPGPPQPPAAPSAAAGPGREAPPTAVRHLYCEATSQRAGPGRAPRPAYLVVGPQRSCIRAGGMQVAGLRHLAAPARG